jgi:hypothetical protein
MASSEQRSEPRLNFGDASGPVLETEGGKYPILDLSARGVRFVAQSADVTIGDVLRATIHLAPDRAFEVVGRVLRASQEQVAARLDTGQPVVRDASRHRPLRGLHW